MGMRTILGFDYGQVRIGVAIAQELTASARPLLTLKTSQGAPPWPAIAELISEWRPQQLVVGLPYQADGSANTVTQAALRFAEQLRTRAQLPVATVDERLSSYAAASLLAERQGKRRKPGRRPGRKPGRDKAAVDRVAAALILETWLQQQT